MRYTALRLHGSGSYIGVERRYMPSSVIVSSHDAIKLFEEVGYGVVNEVDGMVYMHKSHPSMGRPERVVLVPESHPAFNGSLITDGRYWLGSASGSFPDETYFDIKSVMVKQCVHPFKIGPI